VSFALASAAPLLAQQKGNNGNGNGNGHGHGAPPSHSALAAPASIAGSAGTTPFAWIDDANLLAPGSMWLGVSVSDWRGTAASELNVPVVDAAVGLTSRVQLGASVPRVVGSTDPAGTSGGVGTAYVNSKIGLLNGETSRVKLAVAPTLEVLSAAAAQTTSGGSRAHWGVPASVEIDRGVARVYGSGGYFSPGIWFTGSGIGAQVSRRASISGSMSRAWSTAAADPLAARPSRTELSGGLSYSATPSISVFGSVGRTLATTDDNAAGTTVTVGLSVLLPHVVVARPSRYR
jgi:hypothetical protein